jgi:proteic killer suppression protein
VDTHTEHVFNGLETKAARKLPKALWRIIHRKLLVLDAATNLVTLGVVPGYRLEALKGDQRGRHSIRVNDQYRITFRFEGGHAHDVTCEDYH